MIAGPERVDQMLQCPHCPDGRLAAYEKHIDLSKPAWRRFDCGHYIDDRTTLWTLRAAGSVEVPALPQKEKP